MKSTIIIALLLLASIPSFSQSKSVDALYQKHKSNQDFFHMDLGGNFMNFAQGMNIKMDKGNMEAIANSVERIKLFKLPVSADLGKAEFSSLQKALHKEKFELMLEATEKKSGVMVYTKGNARINDIVVMVNGNDGGFLVVELQGDFDAKTIADAGKNIK